MPALYNQNQNQTRKRFKRKPFIRTKTPHANFLGNPIYQATKIFCQALQDTTSTEFNRKQISGLVFQLIFHCFSPCNCCLSFVLQLDAIQYNTIQLYCLCVEKCIFWLVIYIKHSIHFTIKHQHFNRTRS